MRCLKADASNEDLINQPLAGLTVCLMKDYLSSPIQYITDHQIIVELLQSTMGKKIW